MAGPVLYYVYIFNHTSKNSGALQSRHNELDGVSNHLFLDCLLNRFSRRRSKKTSKLHVTGLSEGNSPVAGEFPSQRASTAKNISIWWRHHGVHREYTMFQVVQLLFREQLTIKLHITINWPWHFYINPGAICMHVFGVHVWYIKNAYNFCGSTLATQWVPNHFPDK